MPPFFEANQKIFFFLYWIWLHHLSGARTPAGARHGSALGGVCRAAYRGCRRV